VNSGTIDLHVEEEFHYLQNCFGDFCSKGDFGYYYEVKTSIQGQFFILAADNVVDFVINQVDKRAFTAAAGNGKKLPCVCYCINCPTCCSFCLCCGCCSLCGCNCCKDCCVKNYLDEFTATDSHVVGAEPPMVRDNKFVSNEVSWETQTRGEQQVAISLFYKSQLNGTVRQCKVKLAQNQSYTNAKKFGNTLYSVKKSIPVDPSVTNNKIGLKIMDRK
jgi:hypothetical protein